MRPSTVAWGPVGGAALLLLLLESATLLSVRLRVLLVLEAFVFAALLVARFRLLRAEPRLLRCLAIGVVATFALPLLALPLPQDDPLGPFTREVLSLLAGWSALLVVLPALTERGPAPPPSSGNLPSSRSMGLLLFAGAGLLIAVVHHLAVGADAIISDEAVYLAQSRWMSLSSITWAVEPELAPFFLMRKVDYLNGQLYGMYPPGWPAVLALFRGLGLEWWSSVILGTLSLVLIFRIGSILHGRRAGWYAALLLATSQIFLRAHAGYMAHAVVIFALLAALWALLRSHRTAGWRRRWWCLGAGLMLAVGVTARPLTTLSLGGALSVWMLARAWRESRGAAIATAGWIALGGVIPGLMLIAYNLSVFGEPLALGYQVMHPGMYDLGFGQRGFLVLDEQLRRVPLEFPFTPADGLRAFLMRLSNLNTAFVPIGLLGPILVVAAGTGVRLRWGFAALILALPVVHIPYWYADLRLYTELLPFVLLGVALLLAGMYERGRTRAPGTLIAVILASQAIVALPWPESRAQHRPWSIGSDHRYGLGKGEGRWATIEEARRLADEHGSVLLFTREDSVFDNLIDRLYPFNGDRFGGPILVARDRREQNRMLVERFPDRVAFLVIDRGPRNPADFVRLDPP